MPKDKYEIIKACAFCEYAKCVYDDYTMLCTKKGIVDSEYCCRKFIYDPLKRSPAPQPQMPRLSKDDII